MHISVYICYNSFALHFSIEVLRWTLFHWFVIDCTSLVHADMSSVKSFILDYGLPGLAMVGAGLVTFMLTGGPEEFPSADPDDGVGPAEQDEDFDSNNESNEADEGIMSSTASAPPKWAEEVRCATCYLRLFNSKPYTSHCCAYHSIAAVRAQWQDGRGAAAAQGG